MEYDIEKEIIEIGAFIRLLKNIDVCKENYIDIQTVAEVFAEKANRLYCHFIEEG